MNKNTFSCFLCGDEPFINSKRHPLLEFHIIYSYFTIAGSFKVTSTKDSLYTTTERQNDESFHLEFGYDNLAEGAINVKTLDAGRLKITRSCNWGTTHCSKFA